MSKTKTLYAIIIGINDYPRSPLYGCVNDALDVHQFCSQLAEANDDIKDYQPLFLLAPHQREDAAALNDYGLTARDYQPPTRKNIIQAFDHFKKADPESEDICLLYYSGHGSFQPAPKIFWDLKSGKQVESLVCVDSRVDGGRDLIDKELAYLLWNATNDKTFYEADRKSIHTLLIMDCCHSGDNVRGDSPVRSRMETPNPTRTELKEYEGYPEPLERSSSVESDKRFLQALETWRSARYVHLAAARESETAKETLLDDRSSGVFTYSLLKTLRNGGTHLSYQQLIERIKVMVKNRVDEQIPLLFATEPKDGDLSFMGGGLKEPVKEYVVTYDTNQGMWLVNAGANAGIVPSDPKLGKTIMTVWRRDQPDTAREVEVLAVRGSESDLDAGAFSGDDHQQEDWIAKVTNMAVPTIKVFIHQKVDAPDREKLLKDMPSDEVPTYEFVDKEMEAQYIVYHIQGEYVLTKKGSNVPVFRRTENTRVFLTALQSVGQWLRVLELENPQTTIVREDLALTAEIVEGVPLRLNNLNSVPSSRTLEDPSEISLSYKKQKGNPEKQLQPGLRLRIKTTNRPYYISCLYMDSQYGIKQNLGTTEVRPDGSGEWIKFINRGIEYRTIPTSFDDNYHKLGITEITDYLKIFVSTREFPVNTLEQDYLELDDKLVKIKRSTTITTKGAGLDDEEEFENTGDWTSFVIPVKIKRPLSVQEQPVGGTGRNVADIGGARLTVPQGFSARVSAASAAEIHDMVNEATTRSVEGADELSKNLLPPPILWGAAPSRNTVFSRGVSTASPDAQLSVLELTGALGDNIVSEENPIIFEPDGGLEDDEVLVPFGYDEESGLYLPLGFSDETGQVHIENLPKPTNGKIIGDQDINERSLTGSIKLFFKKVVVGTFTGQTAVNTLAKCSLGADGVSATTAIGDKELADAGFNNICLLIHGIIGDTETQRQAFFENGSRLHEHFDVVISYDYENLNTPIEDTARLLKKALAKAGVTEDQGQRLTIVAHSMGGLVSRWFIEHEGGDKIVKELVQLGTPNGGSETSDFRKSVFGMLSMAMNGAAFLKPYLPVLSFIGKKVTKAVFYTLDQMSPTESDFLKKLNKEDSPKSTVPYLMIGGNTNEIKIETLDGEPLLKQFWSALKKKAPYMLLNKLVFKSEDPNDMAVTQVSMKKVPTQDNLPFYSVGCDHISYFNFESSMAKLQEILDQRS